MPQSVANKILRRIRAKGRGSVFIARDFLDLGSRSAVDQTLSRLARRSTIRRVRRGVYDYPRHHDSLGELSPSVDDVASAIARSSGRTVQMSGARAANLLGLSTQVPAKPVFLTNGARAQDVSFGNQTIALRPSAPRYLGTDPTRTYELVFQALRHLGKHGADEDVIRILTRKLTPEDKRELCRQIPRMPTWMHDIVRRIAGGSC